ncbi:MAG: alpha/beta hydrolase, partial [Rhodospirillales bacterium]
YLLGASMGGAVAMVAMTSTDRPTVDGVILAGPAVWGRATMPWYQTAALWIGAHTVGWLKLTGKGLKIKPSDNRQMLLALGRDPLIIKETRIDTIYGVTNLMDAALAVSGDFAAKALILYGEHDEIVPPEPTFRMLKALPPSARERQKVALYEAGYHMLLRDLQGETVWRDIAAWIEDPTQPLPSGAGKRAEEKLAGN